MRRLWQSIYGGIHFRKCYCFGRTRKVNKLQCKNFLAEIKFQPFFFKKDLTFELAATGCGGQNFKSIKVCEFFVTNVKQFLSR